MTTITPLIKEKKTKVFPIFVIATLGLEVLVLLVLLVQFIALGVLANRPVPNLVEMVDGRAIQVGASDPLIRKPETIRRFVTEAMTLMFDWSGNLPPESIEEAKSPVVDPGMPVKLENGSSERVTSSTWEASFALSTDFRNAFVRKVAVLTPNEVFASDGGTQGLLVLKRVGLPEPINGKPGQWKVPMVSNLIIFSAQDQVGQTVPFNKEIFVQSVDPQLLPLEEKSSALAQIVYRMRQSGLEIYKIRDLELGN